MALKGVLRPGYIQIRVLDMDAAIKHYVDHIGLHEVSREADGRVYLRAWDEFDRHSVILRRADMPGMDYVGFKVASDADLDSFHHRIEELARRLKRFPRASSLVSGGGSASSCRPVTGSNCFQRWRCPMTGR